MLVLLFKNAEINGTLLLAVHDWLFIVSYHCNKKDFLNICMVTVRAKGIYTTSYIVCKEKWTL